MALVMQVCEHIYVLDFGKLIFAGTPAEVADELDRAGRLPRRRQVVPVSDRTGQEVATA